MTASDSNNSGTQQEDAVRAAVRVAARAVLAVPSHKQWVVDFLAESILADLMDETGMRQAAEAAQKTGSSSPTCSKPSKQDPGGQCIEGRPVPQILSKETGRASVPASTQHDGTGERTALILLSQLPADAEEAESRFSVLLYDSLDDVGVAVMPACVPNLL